MVVWLRIYIRSTYHGAHVCSCMRACIWSRTCTCIIYMTYFDRILVLEYIEPPNT